MDEIIDSEPLSVPRQTNSWRTGFFAVIIIGISLSIIGAFSFQRQFKLLSQQCEEKTIVKEAGSEETKNKKPLPLKIDSWQEFSDPKYNFTFKYPTGWFLKDYGREVQVSNYAENCENCSEEEKRNYYYFDISPENELEGKERTDDPLIFLLRGWLNFLEEEKKRKVKEGKNWMPIAPGWTRQYKDEELHLFKNQSLRAIEITPFFFVPVCDRPDKNGVYGGWDPCVIQNEYVFVKNGRAYSLRLASPGYNSEENRPTITETTHPLIQIVQSLTFL